MSVVKGDVEKIAKSGQQLVTFSEDLSSELASIKGIVDEVAELTFGSASDKLLGVYNSLDKDLKKYAVELDTLGTNVQTSASNIETINTEAYANLSYSG